MKAHYPSLPSLAALCLLHPLLVGTAVSQITVQPPAYSLVPLGSPVSVPATVSGAHSSQWFKTPYTAAAAVVGQVTDTLTIPHASIAQATDYKLKPSNAALSNVAVVAVIDRTPHTTLERAVNSSVVLNAKVWNLKPGSSYQWYYDLNNPTPITSSFIPGVGVCVGQNTANLTVSSLAAGNHGFYCEVMDLGGNVDTTNWFPVNVTPVVPPIPSTALGSYVAIIDPGFVNGGAGGRIDFALSATALSAKVYMPGQVALSFVGGKPSTNGTELSAYLVNTTMSPPMVISVEIDLARKRMDNTVNGNCWISRGVQGAQYVGWQRTNPLPTTVGRYNYGNRITGANGVSQPMGRGPGSFTIATNGLYTMAGRTACDEAYTCAAFVGPDGNQNNMALYYAPTTLGSRLSGTFTLDMNNGHYLDGPNTSLVWTRTPTINNIYPAGFQAPMDIYGGKYAATPTQIAAMLFATGGNLPVVFMAPGLPAAWNPDRNITFSDVTSGSGVTTAAGKASYGPSLTSVGLTHSTGFTTSTSQFTLMDFSSVTFTNITRVVKFYGNTLPIRPGNLPADATIQGYFMVPQLPTVPFAASPVYSGLFYIQ
jgi:hypothetical protein